MRVLLLAVLLALESNSGKLLSLHLSFLARRTGIVSNIFEIAVKLMNKNGMYAFASHSIFSCCLTL